MRIFHARTRARIAVLTLLSLLTSPVEPLLLAQTPSTNAPAEKDGGDRFRACRRRLAARLLHGERRGARHVSAAGGELGRSEARGRVRGGVLHAQGRDASRRSARSRSSPTRAWRSTSASSASRSSRSPSRTSRRSSAISCGTVVEEIAASVPLDERVIALDRVLANIDTSQIIPKNVEGVKADPPPIFFSKTPAVLVNIDGDPIWAPIEHNDLKIRGQHQLGSVRARSDQDLLPAQRHGVAEGGRREGAVDAGRHAAGELHEAAGRRQLEGREGGLPGTSLSASQAPKVFVSTTPAELILLRGAPNYLAVPGAKQLLWVSNTESDVFRHGPQGRRSTSWSRAAGSPRRTSPVRGRSPRRRCRRTSRRSRSSIRARACWRRCRARRRRPKRCCSRRFRRRRASARTVKAPEVAYQGGTPQFQPIEKTTRAARGQHRQGHHQGRRPLLHVLPGRLVHVDDADRPVGSDRRRAEGRSTRFRSARRPTPSPTSRSRSEQRRGGLRDGGGLHRR